MLHLAQYSHVWQGTMVCCMGSDAHIQCYVEHCRYVGANNPDETLNVSIVREERERESERSSIYFLIVTVDGRDQT